MKAISLIQPWASLLFAPPALRKRYETRSWPTSYRGPLAIHASGRASFYGVGAQALCLREPFAYVLSQCGFPRGEGLPFGVILGVLDIVDCIATSSAQGWRIVSSLPSREEAFGDFSQGRYLFDTARPRLLARPIAYRGALGVWEVPVVIARQIEAAVEDSTLRQFPEEVP